MTWGLRRKFFLIPVAVALMLGLAVGSLIYFSWSRQLTAELKAKGRLLAGILAARSVDYILIEDMVSLRQLLEDETKLEEDIRWAFIISAENDLVAHTFSEGFPADLLEINPFLPGQPSRDQLLDTGEDQVWDIAVPILNGSLGSVHLGISESHIRHVVRTNVWMIIGLTFVILILGAVATSIMANRVVQPVIELERAAEAIGRGRLDTTLQDGPDDEIGRLTDSFNLMVSRLQHARDDLKNAQEQIVQTGKLALVGQFTAGIAHEINNPLGGILNCVRRLLRYPQITGEVKQYLELVLKGLIRIENIIRQLLTASDQRSLALGSTDVTAVIDESLALLEHRSRLQGVTVEKEASPSLPPVYADAAQLQQVFLNIIKNAYDVMPDGGRLLIKILGDMDLQQTERAISIDFVDTGPGIPPGEINRIFDPFFTSKEVGEGAGLGLWVSYGIVRSHGGTIAAFSKMEKGTTIRVRLPVLEEARSLESME